MDKESPFDIDKIHHGWQALDWTHPRPLSGDERRYAGFYGIDFDQQLDDMQHSFGYFDAAGFRIACHLWQPTKRCRGTVLVGHGYFDHVGLYRHAIRFLLMRGFAVVAFDLPGHGLSSGTQASIDAFSQYQAVFQTGIAHMAAFPKPWHWLAQSTGGAIAMDYLLHTPTERQPFDKIMLLAPLVWPAGWGSGKYLHALLRPFLHSIKRTFAINSHDQAFLDFLKASDPLQSRRLSVTWITAWKRWLPTFLGTGTCAHPLFVIQGDDDTTVDWKKNLPVIRAKFPNADIHVLPDGRHQLVNESEALRDRIFTKLDSQL